MKLSCMLVASSVLAVSPVAANANAAGDIGSIAAGGIEAQPANAEDRAMLAKPSTDAVREAEATKKTSSLDRLWGAAKLYENNDAPILNELRLVGRFHVDHYSVDSDQGDASDLVVRRARFGAKARLFDKLEAHLETELNLEESPLYSRLTDAYLAWKFSEAARLTVGKHSVKFTADGATSSNELVTIDRSNVANNLWFTDEYIPGVSISGRSGKWLYNTGVYSGGREDREFGDFDGGYFWLASIGRDFGTALGVKRAIVRADYVYNKPDPASDFTRPFQHIGVLGAMVDAGRWGFSGDIVAGDGFLGQSDVRGATATPWFSVTKRLQLATRYTIVRSEERNGVRLGRYENAAASGRGDLYQEIYGGLNLLIYGHKLKLQTGLAHARMRDRADDGGRYDGWSWTNALRLSW